MTNSKNIEGKYHVGSLLKGVFGFVENHKKATYGLGYKLSSTRTKDDALLRKTMAKPDVRNNIDHILWHDTHYTPSNQQQGILSKRILSKTPTEPRYTNRPLFREEVKNQNLWWFELGSLESLKVPILFIERSRQRDRQDLQNLTNDSFFTLPVFSDQNIIGRERYPDSGILLNYDGGDFSQGFAQTEEVYRASTEDDIHQPY